MRIMSADESAVAARMAYVDLNPIRAKVATTPETSQFTSAYERIQAQQPPAKMKKSAAPKATKGKRVTRKERRALQAQETKAALPRDHWLSPIALAPNHAAEVALTREMPLAGRASSRGCLPLSDAEYLQLLDWAGRQIRKDKRGAIPSELAPILERLSVTSDSWLKLVTSFRTLFRQSVGQPSSLAREASRRGQQWVQGLATSHAIFGSANTSSP